EAWAVPPWLATRSITAWLVSRRCAATQRPSTSSTRCRVLARTSAGAPLSRTASAKAASCWARVCSPLGAVCSATGHHREGTHRRAGRADEGERRQDEGELVVARGRRRVQVERLDDVD